MSDVTCHYCQLKIHKSSLAKHVRTVHKKELAKQAPIIDMLLGVKRKERAGARRDDAGCAERCAESVDRVAF